MSKKTLLLGNFRSRLLAYLLDLPCQVDARGERREGCGERDIWTRYTIGFIAVTSSILASTILYCCAARQGCIYLSQKCATWAVLTQTDVFRCSSRLSRGRYTSVSAACGYKHRPALQVINPDVQSLKL